MKRCSRSASRYTDQPVAPFRQQLKAVTRLTPYLWPPGETEVKIRVVVALLLLSITPAADLIRTPATVVPSTLTLDNFVSVLLPGWVAGQSSSVQAERVPLSVLTVPTSVLTCVTAVTAVAAAVFAVLFAVCVARIAVPTALMRAMRASGVVLGPTDSTSSQMVAPVGTRSALSCARASARHSSLPRS